MLEDRLAGFEPEHLRALKRTISRGDSVSDPREAPAAIWLSEQALATASRARKPWFLLVQVPPLGLAFVLFRFDLRPLLLAAALVGTYVALAFQKRRLIARATRAAALNRALASSAGVAVPPASNPPSRALRALRPGFVVALAATLVVVGLVLIERRNVDELERWAGEADRVCREMSDAYRAANSFRTHDPLAGPSPLPVVAESRRIAVVIEREGLRRLRELELPRNDIAKVAVRSFELKLEVTERVARLAVRGDRAALDRASDEIVAAGVEARNAFAAAGAPICRTMM